MSGDIFHAERETRRMVHFYTSPTGPSHTVVTFVARNGDERRYDVRSHPRKGMSMKVWKLIEDQGEHIGGGLIAFPDPCLRPIEEEKESHVKQED